MPEGPKAHYHVKVFFERYGQNVPEHEIDCPLFGSFSRNISHSPTEIDPYRMVIQAFENLNGGTGAAAHVQQ